MRMFFVIPSLRAGQENAAEVNEPDLCNMCASVLDKIESFSPTAHSNFSERKIADISYALKSGPCPFCRFLESRITCVSSDEKAYPDRHVLYATSALRAFLPSIIPRQKVLSFLQEHGYNLVDAVVYKCGSSTYRTRTKLYDPTKGFQNLRYIAGPAHSKPSLMMRPISRCIDWGMLQDWLVSCDTTCEAKAELVWPGTVPLDLIDCFSRTVVPYNMVSNQGQVPKYVALSYVWGNAVSGRTPEQTNAPFSLPERCPETIEDAIRAVRHLELRYLWVDMYCVSTEALLKHHQIANMSLVYKMAKLTIIAAAGNDAEAGLPGVGTTSRDDQSMCQVHGNTFCTLPTVPEKIIQKSRWATRGWYVVIASLPREAILNG